jgi:hypothetical protein
VARLVDIVLNEHAVLEHGDLRAVAVLAHHHDPLDRLAASQELRFGDDGRATATGFATLAAALPLGLQSGGALNGLDVPDVSRLVPGRADVGDRVWRIIGRAATADAGLRLAARAPATAPAPLAGTGSLGLVVVGCFCVRLLLALPGFRGRGRPAALIASSGSRGRWRLGGTVPGLAAASTAPPATAPRGLSALVAAVRGLLEVLLLGLLGLRSAAVLPVRGSSGGRGLLPLRTLDRSGASSGKLRRLENDQRWRRAGWPGRRLGLDLAESRTVAAGPRA